MTEQRGSSEEPHQTRQVAESFGVDAARYDRARPPYPVELISRIVELSPGTHVLDVGCGTGIQARQFAAAGCQVLGVDPDTRMAEFARASGLDVEVSTFEEWEPASRTFDAVVAGQAWHWVDPAAGAVKAARVLRGGGPLALFAHVFEPPAEIARVQDEVIRRVVPDLPADVRPSGGGLAGYREMFDKPAAGIAATGEFGEVAQWRFDWERSYTRD
ncbi:methyltransferase family protein [Tamaricihabitans halophyticus]|uniref:Methyltransferase family protein n=1 Tax=Tamaricihabitans halophyticus TaxID=1262583 RepID=A0A4R2QZM3_9PSEU|nr:methyltransferase family protein [Tamaricihabitans halophyticus]